MYISEIKTTSEQGGVAMVSYEASTEKAPPQKKTHNRSTYKKSAIGGTLLTAFVFACIWGMGTLFAPPRHKVGSPSGLQVNWDELDFGTAWSQSAFHFEVEVANASSEPIGPVEAKAFCGCTAVEPKQFRLAPGEAVPLKFTLDLASQLNRDTGKSQTQPFEVGVRLSGHDAQQLLRFEITGSIRCLLSVPKVIQLQREYRPSRGLSEPQTTRISSAVALKELKVDCEMDYVEASVAPSADFDDWLLEVDLKPNSPVLKPGPLEIPLWLRPIAESGERLPSTKVTLRGSVVRNYQVRPERLDLGFVSCDEMITKPLRLYSTNSDQFVFSRVKTKSPRLSVNAKRIEKNAFASEVNIIVAIQVNSGGPVRSSIDCIGILENGREIEFHLPVTAIGKKDE